MSRKLRAGKVRYSRSLSSSPSALSFPTAIALLFILLVTAATATGRLPVVVPAIYACVSLITFITYALDKSAARNNARRTPESTLHLLAIAGGWPGAVLAQQVLRHKSVKKEFRRIFWITVAANCAALACLS